MAFLSLVRIAGHVFLGVSDRINILKAISVDQLHSWSLPGEFRAALEKVAPADKSPARKGGPERLLTEEDYLCSMLFTMFNPVIDSMCGLCACTDFEKVR